MLSLVRTEGCISNSIRQASFSSQPTLRLGLDIWAKAGCGIGADDVVDEGVGNGRCSFSDDSSVALKGLGISLGGLSSSTSEALSSACSGGAEVEGPASGGGVGCC